MLDITPLRSPTGDSDAEPSRVSSLETCESDLRFPCPPPLPPRRVAAWVTKSDLSPAELFYFNATRPDEAAALHVSPLTLPEAGELFSSLGPLPQRPLWDDVAGASEDADETAIKSNSVVYRPFIYLFHFIFLSQFRALKNNLKNTERSIWIPEAKSQFSSKKYTLNSVLNLEGVQGSSCCPG